MLIIKIYLIWRIFLKLTKYLKMLTGQIPTKNLATLAKLLEELLPSRAMGALLAYLIAHCLAFIAYLFEPKQITGAQEVCTRPQ